MFEKNVNKFLNGMQLQHLVNIVRYNMCSIQNPFSMGYGLRRKGRQTLFEKKNEKKKNKEREKNKFFPNVFVML